MDINPAIQRAATAVRFMSWPVALAYVGVAFANGQLWFLWSALLVWLAIQLLAVFVSFLVREDDRKPQPPSAD